MTVKFHIFISDVLEALDDGEHAGDEEFAENVLEVLDSQYRHYIYSKINRAIDLAIEDVHEWGGSVPSYARAE